MTLAAAAAAPNDALRLLAFVAGIVAFFALTRRAAVLGMSRDRIPGSMVLGCVMSIAVAMLVALGVCLVGTSRSGTVESTPDTTSARAPR